MAQVTVNFSLFHWRVKSWDTFVPGSVEKATPILSNKSMYLWKIIRYRDVGYERERERERGVSSWLESQQISTASLDRCE
jgi:hypothetical protein